MDDESGESTVSSELHDQSSLNFLCMLPVDVARSSYGGVVIRYIFLVCG